MQLKQFYNIATKVSSRKKCYYFWWSTWLIRARLLHETFYVRGLLVLPESGSRLNIKTTVQVRDFHGNNKTSQDRLIFIVGIPMAVRRYRNTITRPLVSHHQHAASILYGTHCRFTLSKYVLSVYFPIFMYMRKFFTHILPVIEKHIKFARFRFNLYYTTYGVCHGQDT